MIEGFLVAFVTVFVAELPDKTMVASLILTTRYRRPLAVWVGVVAAFSLHVALAVTIGSLLKRLPDTPVQLAVGALFVVGGIVILRSGDEPEDEVGDTGAGGSFWRIASTSGTVVLLAEFGDLTQLATASIATQYSAPLAVALGAWLALASVAALAVTAGAWIVQHVPLRVIRYVAAAVFLGFGIFTIARALT